MFLCCNGIKWSPKKAVLDLALLYLSQETKHLFSKCSCLGFGEHLAYLRDIRKWDKLKGLRSNVLLFDPLKWVSNFRRKIFKSEWLITMARELSILINISGSSFQSYFDNTALWWSMDTGSHSGNVSCNLLILDFLIWWMLLKLSERKKHVNEEKIKLWMGRTKEKDKKILGREEMLCDGSMRR